MILGLNIEHKLTLDGKFYELGVLFSIMVRALTFKRSLKYVARVLASRSTHWSKMLELVLRVMGIQNCILVQLDQDVEL